MNVSAPRLQRGAAFVDVGEALVDCGHAPDRSARVIENPIDHVRREIQSRHAGGRGAPEIVQRPVWNLPIAPGLRHCGVEPLLGAGETRYGRFAGGGEDETLADAR